MGFVFDEMFLNEILSSVYVIILCKYIYVYCVKKISKIDLWAPFSFHVERN
jgi:hypothetical protein